MKDKDLAIEIATTVAHLETLLMSAGEQSIDLFVTLNSHDEPTQIWYIANNRIVKQLFSEEKMHIFNPNDTQEIPKENLPCSDSTKHTKE